jgi:hypothetical protein
MNLDDLLEDIAKVSSEKVVQDLSRFLVAWKESEETAEQLRQRVERYFGNTWVEKDEDRSKIYRLWASFRDEAIAGIGGMTMNERLYWSGLINRYDASRNESDKLLVYRKLHANP